MRFRIGGGETQEVKKLNSIHTTFSMDKNKTREYKHETMESKTKSYTIDSIQYSNFRFQIRT